MKTKEEDRLRIDIEYNCYLREIFNFGKDENDKEWKEKIEKWLNKFNDDEPYTGRVIKFEGKINLLEKSK